ncbi:MAG: hypothetical protein ABL995_01460 [Bryobacteraceae bacterium]
MGLTHFIYAYRGQFRAIRSNPKVQCRYWLAVGISGLVLGLLFHWIGPALFGALAWTYFIGHFMKAERLFAEPSTETPISSYLQAVGAFAWFSFVLFNIADIQGHPLWLFAGSGLLAATVLLSPSRDEMLRETSKIPLLSLFLIGEALVWGTYGQWMTLQFRTGVYVFHVAGASFFHYIGSYSFAIARAVKDPSLKLDRVFGLNVAVIALGGAVIYLPGLHWASPVLGVEYFTFWVALHLVSSDLFPYFRKVLV